VISSVRRNLRRAVPVAIAACAISLAATIPAQALVQPKPLTQNYHSEGPISAADIDLLNKVNQANIWEGTVSEQIAETTGNDTVRLIAQRLHKDHEALAPVTQDLAEKYGVVLGNQATRQQQQWMAQILGQTGDAADRTYINIVRAAHGTVFQTISGVRATSQNDDMRTYAQAANEIVMRHMTLLEGSGLAQTTSLAVDSVSTNVINQPNLTVSQILLSTLGAILTCLLAILLVRRFGRWGRPEVS
jgi:putative membrane protein